MAYHSGIAFAKQDIPDGVYNAFAAAVNLCGEDAGISKIFRSGMVVKFRGCLSR